MQVADIGLDDIAQADSGCARQGIGRAVMVFDKRCISIHANRLGKVRGWCPRSDRQKQRSKHW